MKVDYEAADLLALRLGVSLLESYVDLMSSRDKHLEHLCHEIGHALLLRCRACRLTLDRGMAELTLRSIIDSEIRHRTHGRRRYRDEAHVLVATFRLLSRLCDGADLSAFESVSRVQKIKRHEWNAAIRSPHARVLEHQLRRYLSDQHVLVPEIHNPTGETQ